ncbi:MAG: hypothetical protein HYR51_13205 [Candidatus Rokubacteria bacterium]|nr:hypothetical protein [Candidatus Rokubacteria bacterium]
MAGFETAPPDLKPLLSRRISQLGLELAGNAQPEALPPVELDLSRLPKGAPRIAGSEVKRDAGTRAHRSTRVRVPRLAGRVRETIERYAVTAFQALGLRDYARMDVRLARDGTVYLIEANPNPYLHSGAEFMRGARASGRTHPRTILEIVEHARARYASRALRRRAS